MATVSPCLPLDRQVGTVQCTLKWDLHECIWTFHTTVGASRGVCKHLRTHAYALWITRIAHGSAGHSQPYLLTQPLSLVSHCLPTMLCTGSGKTHTMIGPRLSRAGALATISQQGGDGGSLVEGADGVLPRALMAAYAGIEQRSDLAEFTVSASCLELYNESVTDLLGPDKNKQLAVRKDERGSFRVDGLTQMTCKTAGAALKAMARALQHRHTRAHALNDYSSRSHCLMTFVFASKERVPEAGGSQQQQGAAGGLRRYGKLVLVDLAGSERLRETGNTAREAVRETGAINKSLFTLGQVLASLAQRSSRGSDAFGAAPVHVPFRDSKLTQLLWDGLRGSGRALMLACLSPMKPHAEESLNTLHFAGMALRIKATPVVLLDPQVNVGQVLMGLWAGGGAPGHI